MDFPFIPNVQSPGIHCEDSSKSREGLSTTEENDLCNAVLRYIGQTLMEDDLEDKASMIQQEDSALHTVEKSLYDVLHQKSALHTVEKSLYDVLHQKSSPPNQHLPLEDASSSTTGAGEISDLHEYVSSHLQNHFIDRSTFLSNSPSFCPLGLGCSCHKTHVQMDSLVDVPLENHGGLVKIGIEKSKNMIPGAGGDGGVLYFEENRLTPAEEEEEEQAMAEKDERDLSASFLKGRRSIHRDDGDLGVRSNKNFAFYADESIIHEMFAKLLSLYGGQNGSTLETVDSCSPNEASRKLQKVKRANDEMTYSKKGATKRAAINMRSLLIQCMQSVAGNGHKSAVELLKQIRARSSPWGSGSQRLAHYFANGLEARLVGAGIMEYTASPAINLSGADVLRGLKLFLSTFPFMETSYFFANEMIMKLAEKAANVHIINFGIDHGFQWPPLIKCLSTRPGGPPKLRITVIDLLQAGSRPRVKDTGCRMASYCESLNVRFQYKGIAKKWDAISVEDLGIEKDEVLVVNCMFLSRYLFDDTIMKHCPRDAFLNLIKMISPDIFIHGIVNATHNSPFLITRFREALFYFSTLFDMFDAYLPRENPDRMVFERELMGNQILNIIAQEGLERIERPETYKQWQIRKLRAGFRQIPLNQDILHKIRAKVKSYYDKDFFVDEAGHWMIEGWKGRALIAFSCWKLS